MVEPVPGVFDELTYLTANPDVASAVALGNCSSGRYHFEAFGRREGRPLGSSPPFKAAKEAKLRRLVPLLRHDLPHVLTPFCFDFLTDEMRGAHGIDQIGPESSHNYDGDSIALFDRQKDGLVLDVGAGRRSIYYQNVVNFEIAPFVTTDVRGVAEELPFNDSVFDGVVSIAVLEHVRDPFRASTEMIRVLKPGGELLCCAPFLQPLHGYPHHYYNMTHEGLRHLFDGPLQVERLWVPESTLPIWSLSWILRSWMEGLEGSAKDEFKRMTVGGLLGEPSSYLHRTWVRELNSEKNFELASASVLLARKPQ